MAICFYFLWAVPEFFRNVSFLFWYLVIINLFLRTATTIFFVPYVALGFEICTDYFERSKLQGVRVGFNMALNLIGPAMAWAIFFKDRVGEESTSVESNFVNMGTTFSIAMLIFVFMIVFSTKKYAKDSRKNLGIVGNDLSHLYKDLKDTILDRHPRTIFIFILIAGIGFVFVACLQMYIYVYFMKFSSMQKSFVHGSGMIGAGAGALVSSLLVRVFDKKATVCMGAILSIICNLSLAFIFSTGLLPTDLVYDLSDKASFLVGYSVPVSMICFTILQALYWSGWGIMLSVSSSMMADVSEVNMHKTGVTKDGSYAAMFSFVIKAATSLGILLSGFCLSWVGFISGSETQSPEAINGLAMITFIGGAAISIMSIIAIAKYSINKEYMEKIKSVMPNQLLIED